jgi:Cu2+-exporting ATPase
MHFQELLSAAGNYSIKVFNPNDALLPTEVTIALQRMLQENTTPMFCEDDKVYDEAGDCPCLCDMDLVQTPTPAKQCTPAPCILKLSRKGRAPVPAAEWI